MILVMLANSPCADGAESRIIGHVLFTRVANPDGCIWTLTRLSLMKHCNCPTHSYPEGCVGIRRRLNTIESFEIL